MSISRPRLQQNFSRAAATYDAFAEFQHTQTQRLYDYAHAQLPADARLLDIGCGTGSFARAAAADTAWRVTGIDLAEGMCRVAHQHSLPVMVADATSLPIADTSFDAVVSSLCLQWVEDIDRALAEIARVLKPGGRALLISLSDATLAELHQSCVALNLPLALLQMRATQTYLQAAKSAGLQVMAQEAPLLAQHYATPRALLDTMRRIGAGNAQSSQQRITPSQWRAWDAYYRQHYSHPDGGVIAHWQPLLIDVIKPA